MYYHNHSIHSDHTMCCDNIFPFISWTHSLSTPRCPRPFLYNHRSHLQSWRLVLRRRYQGPWTLGVRTRDGVMGLSSWLWSWGCPGSPPGFGGPCVEVVNMHVPSIIPALPPLSRVIPYDWLAERERLGMLPHFVPPPPSLLKRVGRNFAFCFSSCCLCACADCSCPVILSKQTGHGCEEQAKGVKWNSNKAFFSPAAVASRFPRFVCSFQSHWL